MSAWPRWTGGACGPPSLARKASTGRPTTVCVVVVVALLLLAALETHAQATRGFPIVVDALRASPDCLGVETGQTANGRQVIFAWFDGKTSLVDWYRSDAHQRAMKAVFPRQTFDRQPLPDLAEDSGPILTIVSVKFAESHDGARRISSIGIELYGPLPGGIAVGGRFAPPALQVRGLREITIESATSGRAPTPPAR